MERISYILTQFYQSTRTPVHVYTPDGSQNIISFGFMDGLNPLKTDATLLPWLGNHTHHGEKPWLHYEMDVICYGTFRDIQGYLFIVGPVCLYKHNEEIVQQYAKHHRLPIQTSLPVQNIMRFSHSITLLCYTVTGQQVDASELAHMNFSSTPTPFFDDHVLQTYVMDRREEDSNRFSYLAEKEKMQQIINGDVEVIRGEITPDILRMVEDMTGKMATQPIKQWEYSVVVTITLASRAAVLGGVPPVTAYALSDTMLQRLSKCTDFPSILQLQGEVRLTFAACVRDFRKQSTQYSLIEEAKVFMRTNLNKSITLEDLAAHVNLSSSHLCRKFKEAEGITPMDYLQSRRIKAAKSLLRYSDNSISYIAQYLCFHSQSHFGVVFKKQTGMTPKQYRDSRELESKLNTRSSY